MKLLKIAWIAAFAFAVAVPVVYLVLAGLSTEAQLIAPFDETKVTLNKAMFSVDKSAPNYPAEVMAIYGLPQGEPIRVLFVPKERYLRPEELPSLTLLPVDTLKGGGNPLQLQMVYFFAKCSFIGAVLGGGGLLGLWLLLRRRLLRTDN